MAQKIFFNWQDDDSTKDLNHKFLGLIEPGRYRGYDGNLITPGGLTLRLSPDITGVDMTLYDTPQSVERRSMLFTKQGVVVQESGYIDIPIAPNNAADPRIDIVICEHEYVDIPGASTADYLVQQGTPAVNPVAPTLTAPTQIKLIIGYLYLPSGTTSLSSPGVIYTPATAPYFNNSAQKLVTLDDVEIQNPLSVVPESNIIISNGDGTFKDQDIHQVVRERNFKLAKTFELGQSKITDFTGLIVNISTSGPVKNGLIITPDNNNNIVIDSGDTVVVDALPNTFQEGTELTFILTRGSLTFNTNSIVNSGPTVSGWVELKNPYQTTDTELGSIVLVSNYSRKRIIKAYRFQYYWLLVELGAEILQTDFDQNNINSTDFLKNRPFVADFTQQNYDSNIPIGSGNGWSGKLLNLLIGGTVTINGGIIDYTGYDNTFAAFTITKNNVGQYQIGLLGGGASGFDKNNYKNIGIIVQVNGANSLLTTTNNIIATGGYIEAINVLIKEPLNYGFQDSPFTFLIFKLY